MTTPDIHFEDFRPPSARRLRRLMSLSRWYFSPRIDGLENVDPARPALLVGNHAIFGMLDSSLFFSEFYSRTGVFPRSLGDHGHFGIPGWGKLLVRYGAVPGTRANCARLMQAGQHIIVFPGGAREVAKRRDEVNRLVWKKRTGFVRMAISHGYDILPFASLGCDEAWSILYDGNDFAGSRLGNWLLKKKKVNDVLRGGDVFMPLVRGLGPTPLPRPEPFYFRVGKPIPTCDYPGSEDSPDVLWALREKTAHAIEGMLADLQARRAAERDMLPTWRRKLL